MFIWLYFILFPLISTLIFTHCHYKKNKFFSFLDDYLLFKRLLFNKKINYQTSNKVIISHLFFFLFFLYFSILYVAVDSMYFENIGELLLIAIMSIIIFLFVPSLIIRLIYEFLVLPYFHGIQIQQYYAQNMNIQPNMQNNQVMQPASNVTETIINTSNTNETNESVSNEQQFKFCSQCGTRYDINATTCPKCGES